MSSLRSIVYVSSATHELPAAELERLLEGARAENRKNQITGVLFYAGGSFMQCFEGPEDAVSQTYARIRASRRHHDIFELMNERVDRRSFDGWDMALSQPTPSALLALSTARWRAQADGPVHASPKGDGLGLMKALWQSARR